MFSIFKKNSKDDQIKKNLFDFWVEMEKNMELFYVMDQRQFVISGFLTEMWPRVKGIDLVMKYESISQYAKSILDFNEALKVHKEYEAWYIGDINNKTPENSRKLHALKHDMDSKLKGMEAVIILAGQDLEREMLKLGLLKA